MNKKLSLFVLLVSVVFCGCSKIDTEITYQENSEITGYEYSKLAYLLEGVIDIENDKIDVWNKPLASDYQKGRFIFNILNNNYMDKYENPMEASETPVYPVLDETLYVNGGDIHDGVVINDQDFKVGYKKSDIDKILVNSIGNTVSNGEDLNIDGLVLSGDNYLLFNYKYYGSDLIGNKGRATFFNIDSINQASDKDIEVIARYSDDFLQEKENYDIGECNLTYHISKNPGSFYGYTINEYRYSGCNINTGYLAPDMPSQIIYGLRDGIYNDYHGLKKEFRSEEINIDLNNDGKEEFFRIGVDSPNGTQVLGVVGDKGYNFIYDFSGDYFDDYNELRSGLFIDMYFDNIDGGEDKEVIVAIGDKKSFSEANIYKIGGDEGFIKLGSMNGKSYLSYDENSQIFHAPYSINGLCQMYGLTDGKIIAL